jgi:predicted ATPase/class 3 adenylate cyclase
MASSVAGPPSGQVTLVFTDIEGSTLLLQALGDNYQHVLADHRTIMREAWVRWNGYEMGTEGDSFFVSFPSASDAVAAAVQGQRELAAHQWPDGAAVRVRIGMHTGEPTVVGGDYVGIDVHRAARIAAAGHGGQIVVSQVTRDLVDRALPDGVGLRDLGEHRLKDLEQPEWLFQLVIDGLQEEFAALKSLETPTNLPSAPSEFIGREEETAQLVELLQGETRLVTLTGPGGTGKTRFAIHAASQLLDRFKNGVFFASISPSLDADSVPSEIAAALHIPEQGGRMPFDAVVAYLRDKSVLLVLDNFEHVLDAAPVVSGLISAAPRLKMIVTSRARLHVTGERELPVEPLPVPSDARDLIALARSGAVALFVQRAHMVRSDFELTSANAEPVLEICRRLDGLPLAIELAASKAKILSPQQILERLGSRLALLKGGARDLPARQQTLRDTIGWSYELLDEDAAHLFRLLGVFSGGATLDAIEGVAGEDVLDALSSLVDHSLVRQDSEPRFSMLETIREYALERLEAEGETEKARRAHAEYMLRVAEEAGAGLRGPEQNRWRRVLEADHDNMRGALTWCFADGGDPNLGARIAIRLGQFWYSHGFAVDGIAWLEEARAKATDLPPDLRALLLQRLGILFDQRSIAARAAVLFEQAAALYRELGDQSGTAFALNSLGSAERSMGNMDGAEALWNESLSLRRAVDDKSGAAATLCNLGTLALDRGEPERAQEFLEEARTIDTELGDEWAVAIDESGLAEVALDLGDLERARPVLRRTLDAFCEMGEHDRLAETFSRMAGLAAAEGDPIRSARLSGAAEALWEAIGIPLAPPDRARFEHFQTKARAAIDPAAYEQAWAEGRAMTMDQAVAYALADGAG